MVVTEFGIDEFEWGLLSGAPPPRVLMLKAKATQPESKHVVVAVLGKIFDDATIAEYALCSNGWVFHNEIRPCGCMSGWQSHRYYKKGQQDVATRFIGVLIDAGYGRSPSIPRRRKRACKRHAVS